jgi:hypothetical protein
MAVVVFRDGLICGTDANGVLFDGMYKVENDTLKAHIQLTVPPGVALVQGTPAQPTTYQLPTIVAEIPLQRIGTSAPTLVQTDAGPVNILIRKLRDLGV